MILYVICLFTVNLFLSNNYLLTMHLIPTYIKGKNALKLKVTNYSCNQILFKRQKAKYTYFGVQL